MSTLPINDRESDMLLWLEMAKPKADHKYDGTTLTPTPTPPNSPTPEDHVYEICSPDYTVTQTAGKMIFKPLEE